MNRIDAIEILRIAADECERGNGQPISDACDLYDVRVSELCDISDRTGVLVIAPVLVPVAYPDLDKRDRCLEAAQLLEDEEVWIPDVKA